MPKVALGRVLKKTKQRFFWFWQTLMDYFNSNEGENYKKY
jgi:hypothetical protein